VGGVSVCPYCKPGDLTGRGNENADSARGALDRNRNERSGTRRRLYTRVWNLKEIERKGGSIYFRGTGAYHHILAIHQAKGPFGRIVLKAANKEFPLEYTGEIQQIDDSYVPRGPEHWRWPLGRLDQWGVTPPHTARWKRIQDTPGQYRF
jgi:hypothetical protein